MLRSLAMFPLGGSALGTEVGIEGVRGASRGALERSEEREVLEPGLIWVACITRACKKLAVILLITTGPWFLQSHVPVLEPIT